MLMLMDVPTITASKFPIASPIEIRSVLEVGPHNFYNLTLQIPQRIEDFSVKGEVSPAGMPIQVDLWVVNETGFGLLREYLSWGDTFKPEYPNKHPFDTIKTYAKEINITTRTQFELANFDHNGTYCLLFLNFYEATQTASINVEEQHMEPYSHSLLERTPMNMIAVGVVVAIGVGLVVGKPKRSPKRARSLAKNK
jgi:hypothetical protein